MPTLSGQTIQSTYQGLLKLATSTSGVTSTPQQIQDGLGNDTGARIATNFLSAPNVFAMNPSVNFTPDYMGPGFGSAGITPQANQQNKLNAFLFYDSGQYAYSAITYTIISATSTTDVVDVAFYNTQYSDLTGVIPYQLIMSGITLSTTPSGSGIIQTNLPSTLSFSGTGGGFYYMVMKISNAGVTPTIRYGNNPANSTSWPSLFQPILGLTRNRTGNATAAGIGTNANAAGYMMTATNFAATFSTADGAINTSFNPYLMGFALRCVK
jgi:hypothetical protein